METTETRTPSFFKRVDMKCRTNNHAHHTKDITEEKLIVRRGQSFIVTIRLTEAFQPDVEPLTFTAKTGPDPQEHLGTMSLFGIPAVTRSSSAQAVWTVQLQKYSSLLTGLLTLTVTPPSDCPIGKYQLGIKYRQEEFVTDLVVLFNPWCPDDSVFLSSELKKSEYVLNEQGTIYKGTIHYILSQEWDFGQFEEDMVDISLLLLDKSLSFQTDPSADAASRSDPIQVSRVISSVINSEDVDGVLKGRWDDIFEDGVSPSHWTGSHAILSQWYQNGCQEVKYGQCWVFACVMCSVMRLLGIPCRVVTNYNSAHDVDRNLIVDTFRSVHGVEDRPNPDSIWNFHIWVECWFRRPDLAEFGNFDGWQVLDPTPQETSSGVYRCGPAPVKAVLRGRTDLKYDIPFVFAEVNADCVDWLLFRDGDRVRLFSDLKRVGQNISTKHHIKSCRRDITANYKHTEGTLEERQIYFHAVTRDYTRQDEEEDVDWEPGPDEDTDEDIEEDTEEPGSMRDTLVPDAPPAEPDVTGRFEEVTQPTNGQDVSLRLLLHSQSTMAKVVTINISVQAMRHNGTPAALIHEEELVNIVPPGEDFPIPVLIPYQLYHQHMVTHESMRIQAVVSEEDREKTFMTQFDVVLVNPSLTFTVVDHVRVNRRSMVEVSFENPVEDVLSSCSLTLSGSGLLREEFHVKLPDLHPGNRVRVKVYFKPYKKGNRSLMADFDCSDFRDLQASHPITVFP